MWLQRRRAGSLDAPQMKAHHVNAISWWLWLSLLLLGLALPVFGISVIILMALEALSLLFNTKNHSRIS
jgi:uncharacterized iron-regulated membrane protein